MAFEAIIVSHGSYLTTFVKGSLTRNGSNYVKTVGVLMHHEWGCGGQEVPEAIIVHVVVVVDLVVVIIDLVVSSSSQW